MGTSWFADLFAKSKLAERVAKGLDADLEDAPDVVRSAARLVVMLGSTDIWPIERLDKDIAHALARLEALAAKGIVPRAALRADIESLRERSEPKVASLPLLWKVDLAKEKRDAVTRLGAVGPNRWVAGTQRYLKLYDDRGKVIADLSPPKQRGSYAEHHIFATTSGVFVCAEAEETVMYAAKTGEVVHRWPWRFAKDTAVAPDGTVAVVLTLNGKLNVLDLKTGRVRRRLAHPQPRGADGWCAIGPDIAASSWGEAVRLWDLRTGKPIATLKHAHRGIEMTSDASRVLTYTPKGFAVWNVATGKRVIQRSPVVNTPDPALVLDLQTKLLRPRGPGDLPHFLPRWRGEPWVDARTRVSTNEPVDDEDLAIETEVLLHRLDDTEKEHVIARGVIELPRWSHHGRMIPPVDQGRKCRLALTHDRRILLVSDRAARVYAFGLP